MFKVWQSLLLLIFLLLPQLAWGAPSISGISGTVTNGQNITISGSSFGTNGPEMLLYDSFEKGTSGSQISTKASSADIGNWSELGNTIQLYSADRAVSGNKSMKVDWSQYYGSGPALRYANVQNADIFLSWWQYMPLDSHVPGTKGPEAGLPNWKWFWIGDESDNWPWGSDYVSVCLSDSNCDATIAVFPADDTAAPQRGGGEWIDTTFAKGTWIRVSVAMKNAVSGAQAYLYVTDAQGAVNLVLIF
jgi:hypothetical protein